MAHRRFQPDWRRKAISIQLMLACKWRLSALPVRITESRHFRLIQS
jgi:hypothetical protein